MLTPMMGIFVKGDLASTDKVVHNWVILRYSEESSVSRHLGIRVVQVERSEGIQRISVANDGCKSGDAGAVTIVIMLG